MPGRSIRVKIVAPYSADAAKALLYGDTGIVRDLLPQSSEAVEQRGLAAVWRPDKGDGAEAATRLHVLERRFLENRR